MKKLLLFFTALSLCAGAYAQQALGISTNITSPQVNPDGSVTFRLRAPKAVKVTVTGDLRVKNVSIDPEAVDLDDIEMLEDMILAAVNDAIESAESSASQQMSALTGGLNIPGLF